MSDNKSIVRQSHGRLCEKVGEEGLFTFVLFCFDYCLYQAQVGEWFVRLIGVESSFAILLYQTQLKGEWFVCLSAVGVLTLGQVRGESFREMEQLSEEKADVALWLYQMVN